MVTEYSNCAECPFEATDRICSTENGKYPNNCPTIKKPEVIKESLKQSKYKRICQTGFNPRRGRLQ